MKTKPTASANPDERPADTTFHQNQPKPKARKAILAMVCDKENLRVGKQNQSIPDEQPEYSKDHWIGFSRVLTVHELVFSNNLR